jgi:hypothetical protein
MRYSCFDPATGLYDYFEDSRSIPINADLPVPKLPGATQIGVASIEAGRPLPSDAQRIGQGWNAQGQIVQCGRGPRGGALGAFDFGSVPTLSIVTGIASTAVAFWIVSRIFARSPK